MRLLASDCSFVAREYCGNLLARKTNKNKEGSNLISMSKIVQSSF